MTRKELKRKLDWEGIRPDAYDLDTLRGKDEVYCLELTQSGWLVYYRERGTHREEHVFSSEEDACRFFLDWVLEDTTTRISR
jgi:hypothetical protein